MRRLTALVALALLAGATPAQAQEAEAGGTVDGFLGLDWKAPGPFVRSGDELAARLPVRVTTTTTAELAVSGADRLGGADLPLMARAAGGAARPLDLPGTTALRTWVGGGITGRNATIFLAQPLDGAREQPRTGDWEALVSLTAGP